MHSLIRDYRRINFTWEFYSKELLSLSLPGLPHHPIFICIYVYY